MRPSSQHMLGRSIRGLAIGVVHDVDQRRKGRAVASLQEREEQFQIAVSGRASDYVAWASIFLPFDTQFVTVGGRRESDLQRPQLAVGIELTSVSEAQDGTPSDAGVILTAAVRTYRFDEADAIDGATVQIGAAAPGYELNFQGFVHLSFQGFGAPGDDQPDEAG